MKIAIDAMGGDHSPQEVVRGSVAAAREYSDLELMLVGDQQEIEKHFEGARPENIQILHAGDEITMDDEPVMAVRKKKDSSMVKTVESLKEGQVDAVISAGNTGAFMAAGLLLIGKMKGIDRPALAPIFPRMDGNVTLVLDVGANMDAKAKHLMQYAVMGQVYMRHVLHIQNPDVGLLNVGTESNKGNDLTKEAYPLLEKAKVHFVGNVEARDLMKGATDILVCDGFSGNILLKSSEGAVGALIDMFKKEFTKTWLTKLAAAILRPSLQRIKDKVDYTEHGGAPLLGLEGVCIKAHGSSDATTFYNAIKQAKTFVDNQVLTIMMNEINEESE